MTVLRVLRYPDPRLMQKSRRVGDGDDIRDLVQDMIETMDAEDGAGLAAPQVGIHLRVFVLSKDVCEAQQVFVNPSWDAHGGNSEMTDEEEGCLSFPGVYVKVRRVASVIVTATSLTGKLFSLPLDSLAAVAVQHETDHLDGRLMIDDLPRHERRRIIATKMRRR
jgi:peptide deformylase